MKSIRRTTVLVVFVSVMLTITTSASSSSLSGTSSLNWTTFSIAHGNDMSFTWVDKIDKTDAFATVNGDTAHDFDQKFAWTGVGSTATHDISGGGITTNGWTTENAIAQKYAATWSEGAHEENGTAARFGTFRVTGSGYITFSIPYSLQYEINLDNGDYGRVANGAGLRAKNYMTSLQDGTEAVIGEDATGTYSNSDSRSGILSIPLYFNNGDTGAVGVGVGSRSVLDSWWLPDAPLNPIPEPEAYAMLLAGLGLLGFAARRRNPQAA